MGGPRVLLRALTGATARLAYSLALVLFTAVCVVGTVDAGHTAGHTSFTNNCAFAGCHGAGGNNAYFNAANASNIIDYAIANGMTSAPAGGTPQIATHIATLLPSNNPANQPVAFNEGPGSGAGTTFDLPNLFRSTTWGGGATSSVSQQSPAPGQGSVTFGTSGAGSPPPYNANYKPNACATGSDSFGYRASGSGGNTSIRTASVVIGNPSSGPTIFTGATLPAGQTAVAYSTGIAVACPSIATFTLVGGALPGGLSLASNGVISGSPTTTVGSPFNFTVRATYTGGAFTDKAFSIAITQGPPTITSAATAPNGSVGVAYSGYTITATNSPTSYGASGLPPGLTVNTSTGAITGTPTDASGSPYTATVTAANGVLPNGSKSVTFNIVPAINSAPTKSGQTGVAFNYQITAAPGPAFTSYAALDTLPAGLSLNTGTGAVTGTPTAVGGPTNVRLTGSNAFGTSAQFTLAITITLGPPVITSSLAVSGGATVPFSYQITATNPPHSAFNATPLPAGLSVNTSSGLISGTPLPGTGGVYSVTLSATNATGTGSATLSLTISESPPVITSPGTASGQTGSPFSYQITATNGTTGFSATGLPPGLTLNATSGLISGTPTSAGTFNATMTATNGSGSDTDPLVITITLGPPTITSASTAGGAQGFPFSYQITATNSPTSFGSTALPAGLTLNTTSGLISGTPTGTGTFNVTISATNATGTATQPLTITIGVGIPVITSAPSASGGTGLAFLHQISATNNPTSYGATGLPAGLAINPATGLITGTPTAAGTFSVNASATNATGTGTQALTITISLRPPSVVTGTPITGVTGVPFSYVIQATGGATAFTAAGLPPGLTLDGTTGFITGTPTAGGTYNVTVGVTNAAGTTTFTLTIIIAFPLPTVGDASASVPFETATPITLPVTGAAFTISIATLPEHGLASVTGNNVVTYTPATGYLGTDSFTYTATNSTGTSGAATVNITVVPVPPTARAALMTVQLNTPTTFSLAPFIKGSGLTGVAIRGQPAHGTVAVNGLSITYTPRTDYFGPDTFTYVAFGSAGASPAATVTVEVVGRPDPSQDRNVVGLVDAQNQAARRFAGAQIGNIQRRMESLHRTEPVASPPLAPTPAPAAAARAEPVRVAEATATAREPVRDIGPLSLVTTLAQVATSHTLALNGAAEPAGRGVAWWIAGSAQFGNIDARGNRSGSRFGTDGVSVGADRRFGERFAGGLAAGFARDETTFGTDGSRSKASAASIAGYGSYQVGPRTYIDMLLGYGSLKFDADRYVTALDQLASSDRKGRQLFGSVAGVYEYRRDNLLVSPYGRVDFSVDRLDAVTENGVGNYALAYSAQDQKASQAALGLRAESKHETEFGFSVPRARAEYRREFGGERRALVSYADLIGGPEYAITTTGASRNSLLLGVGADLVFRGGLKLGFDYTAQRASGAANIQGIRVMLSQDLDAPGAALWRFEPLLFRYPINVDFAYSFDDNVNRAREADEKRWDNVFAMSANVSRNWPIGTNMRVQATALASGEKFDRHAGLGRFSAGGQAELQYRSSGAYDATTLALVGRGLYEQYESHYRTGPRYFLGFNARRALTDRIELFGELGANVRHGNSDVFNWRDYAAKLNIDYALGRKGTLYLTGEYRRGDTVSSGRPSLVNVGLAEVFVPDDVYEDQGFVAYRFDARTILGTVGVNYPLGARDSIDLSWRRVQSSPRKRPAFDFSGPLRYIDNQYSLVYLMRF